MAASVSKAIILDVDGVVVRHPPTLTKVGRRIDKFVAKTVGVSNAHGAKINQQLYKTFGHTYLGLQKVYPQSVTLNKFNDCVYTEEVLRSVHDSTYNVDVIEHIVVLQRFLTKCKDAGVPVYMFSNAPRIWCETVTFAYNLREWIPNDRVISCEHEVFRGTLKPHPTVYSTLQQYLCFEYKNDHLRFIYVDDSFANLVPVLDNPMWKPTLFEQELSPLVSPKLYHASSFRHIVV